MIFILCSCLTSFGYNLSKLTERAEKGDAEKPRMIRKTSNNLGMTFVYLEPPAKRGFYMQTAEVTQGQWEAIMGNSPWVGKNYVQNDKNNPAVYISWYDCKRFIKKLNQKEGTDKYRLPTETEWEFAAQGGSSSVFCYGNSEDRLDEYAWFNQNTWEIGEKYAHGVALKKPNQYGLYDMHGNVWEWCEDKYKGGEKRIHKGGSWYYDAARSRSSGRYSLNPEYRYFSLGFRLSKSL